MKRMKTLHQNRRQHLHPRISDVYFCRGGGFCPPFVVSVPVESFLGMLSVTAGFIEAESGVLGAILPESVVVSVVLLVLLSLQLNNNVEKRKAAAKVPAIVLVLFLICIV